jgi:hypothetical protein
MRETLTEADEGKRVVAGDGDEIGRVVSVDDGAAYVDPDPGITDRIAARLGWTDRDNDSYRVDPTDVATITDDEVRLSA